MPSTTRIVDLFGIALPIIQAPMAGAHDERLAIAVARAGGLGSIPCPTLSPDAVRGRVAAFRAATSAPLNLNFFSHAQPVRDSVREAAWRAELAGLYAEYGVSGDYEATTSLFPIDEAMCTVIEDLKPEVVSFHFGLPREEWIERVRATGAKIISSATTVEEALYLESRGCDAVIAQGVEAGGHRGMFLSDSLTTQIGTFSLIPMVADAVKIPVIAAGGIADGRGIAASQLLGAHAVQIGTRYLKTPEATISAQHWNLLMSKNQPATVITNLFTGRPARSLINRLIREIGPLNANVQEFPLATAGLSPLKAMTNGKPDFVPLWAGQSAPLGAAMGAEELTCRLAVEAEAALRSTRR